MKKFFSVGFATIGSVILVLILIFTSMQVVINDRTFIENEYTKLMVSESMGMSNTDLVKSCVQLIDYMQGNADSIDVEVTIGGVPQQMFIVEQERTHMEDVRTLYTTIRGYRDMGVLAMLVLFLLAAVINFRRAPQTLSQGYLSGGFVCLLVLGFLGTWAASDFSSFWTFFHQALFWNDEWMFDPTESRMINMLPETFFSDVVGRIFLFAGVAFLVLTALSVLCLVLSSDAYKRKQAARMQKKRQLLHAKKQRQKARAEQKAAAAQARAEQKAEAEKAKRLAEKKKRKAALRKKREAEAAAARLAEEKAAEREARRAAKAAPAPQPDAEAYPDDAPDDAAAYDEAPVPAPSPAPRKKKPAKRAVSDDTGFLDDDE